VGVVPVGVVVVGVVEAGGVVVDVGVVVPQPIKMELITSKINKGNKNILFTL